MSLHDVIVVGAGPVGSRTARNLAAAGHSVLVLERNPETGMKGSCTGIVSRECAEAFDMRDVTIREVNSASLFSPSGKVLRLRRQETQACILDRAALDKELAGRAEAAGVEYVLGTPVKNINILKDRVVVEASRHGKSLRFEARAVVLACGFAPGLSERVGLGRFRDFTAGVQAEVAVEGLEEVEVYLGREVAPGFFAWLAPTLPGKARVGLLSRKRPVFYIKKLMDDLRHRGKIAALPAGLSYGVIPLKTLARSYGERLLAVGDAAGQVKPTTGGGIYFGLLCADMAAATLRQALGDDDLSARRMARYERAWKDRLGQDIRIGRWARKFYENMGDSAIDRLFAVVSSQGIDEALLKAEDLTFDWHGRAIMKLLSYRMLAGVAGVVRIPYRQGGVDRRHSQNLQ